MRLHPVNQKLTVNRYRQTSFQISANRPDQFPKESEGEIAFAGRSNAGKSSALNIITDNRTLARTSKTPGRTQLINFFAVDQLHYLVDLPGYGFAKVPERVRQQWQQVLDHYLNQRKPLCGLILLIDSRHPLKEFDQMMVEWCMARKTPCHILLTKADKLKKGPAQSSLLKISRDLGVETREGLLSLQLFSALKQIGVNEARSRLDQLLGYDH
ncbi:MAG: YihA family ribosome biogenesis GTP-binding protein [Gammaproteobacteria bacterium]|nr:YihA family ribosome biogenesis GTP-binding protein [Gammaproteobacteria bacterium]